MPDTDESGAIHMACRILDHVRNLNILHEKSSVEDRVTISLGLTSDKSGKEDHETLIRDADIALSRAKSKGKNRYEVFSPQ